MAAIEKRNLVLRHLTWSAVLEVPRSLRPVLGKRLIRSLKTHSLEVARGRRHAVLAEFQKQIDQARRVPPARGESLDDEAVQFFDQPLSDFKADEQYGPGYTKQEMLDGRVEQIFGQHGDAAARNFSKIASGTAIPIALNVSSWISQGHYAVRTQSQHRQVLKEFTNWCSEANKGTTLEQVTRKVAGEFIGALVDAGQHAKTINRKLFSIRAYWKWLEQRGVTPSNPWEKQSLKTAKSTGRGADETRKEFTDAQLVTLLTGETDDDIRDFMRIAALSGLRIEEIAQLKVTDCTGGIFNILRGKTKAAQRRVPIHSALVDLVTTRSMGKKPSEWLFSGLLTSKAGERSAALSKRFGHYRERVGVDEKIPGQRGSLVNFHSFRKYFATQALQADHPLHIVQQIIGHARDGVTLQVYHGGDTEMRLRAAVESVKLPLGILQAPA